jgi:hypothetical protein
MGLVFSHLAGTHQFWLCKRMIVDLPWNNDVAAASQM